MDIRNCRTLYKKPIFIDDELCWKPPRMTLAWNVPVTKEFRKAQNEWMLEFFGREKENVVYESDQCFIMCNEDYDKIKHLAGPSYDERLAGTGFTRQY